MKFTSSNGKLETYGLEIQASQHCNLNCAGCSQNSPFLPTAFPRLDVIAKSLKSLGKILHAGRVTILGGEPLLNPEIVDLLSIAKQSGVGDQLFVTTNGILLSKMPELFWELVDAVEISIYPNTLSKIQKTLELVVHKAWASKTQVHLLPTPTFKYVTLGERIPDTELVSRIYNACYFKNYCHTLHEGRFYKCAPSVNLGKILNEADRSGLVDAGIEISDSDEMLGSLLRYLNDSTPLAHCSYCLGSSGAEYRHHQMSKRELQRKSLPVYSARLLKGRSLVKDAEL
jgi:hypothetical protein